MILDGKSFSKIIAETRENILKFGFKPGLGIIIVGNRPDSVLYVSMKKKMCKQIGIKNYDVHLPKDVTEFKIINEIVKMNKNPEIHGILAQLPLLSY